MSNSPFIESIWSELRTRHYSMRTETPYLYWIRLFIGFNDIKHPKEIWNHEIGRFLNHLVVKKS